MRFSWSTHLLIFLSLKTVAPIVRTGVPILVELIYLVNCYNFFILNGLTQMVNFPTRIPDCDSHSPTLLDYFFLQTLVFVLQWLSIHWKILIMLLSQFPLTFHQVCSRMPHFIASLMTILLLIGMVFDIICSTGGHL